MQASSCCSPQTAHHGVRSVRSTARVRKIIILGLMTSFMTSGPQAQESAKPTSAERKAVQQCVLDARKARESPATCVGNVAENCQKRPGMDSTVGMRDCFARETAIWDDRLNRNYKALLMVIESGDRAALRDIQRAWIKWRDIKCTLPYLTNPGGTIAGPLSGRCVMLETATRSIELGDEIR